MGDATSYRKRAAECVALASNCAAPEHKAIWLDLEQHWLRLADEIELHQRVDPFAAFLMTNTRQARAG